MANYLRKNAQGLNQHPQSPSGLEGVGFSCRKSSTSLEDQRTATSVPPNTTNCNNPTSNYALQVWNMPVSTPNSQKVSHGKDQKHNSTPATAKYQLDLKVNRNDQACRCYSDSKAATRKFSARNLIDEGGFGDVYKGCKGLCTMIAAIAVKKLRKNSPQGNHE